MVSVLVRLHCHFILLCSAIHPYGNIPNDREVHVDYAHAFAETRFIGKITKVTF